MSDSTALVWAGHNIMSCRRKVFALAPTFEIFDAQGASLVYCQEKIFKIKDDIRIFSDSSKTTELLRIQQRNIIDWAGVFDVVDSATGAKLGGFRRKGWRSMFRDEWEIMDANDMPIGKILETGSAFLRRIFKFLPYTFAFHIGEQQVGAFDQEFAFFTYKATMDITAWRNPQYDRRLAFAAALLLMAVEAKEDRGR
jgi:hypothetical protein